MAERRLAPNPTVAKLSLTVSAPRSSLKSSTLSISEHFVKEEAGGGGAGKGEELKRKNE